MGKVDNYYGGYLLLDNVSDEASSLLASSLCSVGTPLTLKYDIDSSSCTVHLSTGQELGTVRPHNRLWFKEALEGGWTCRAWLSLVYYDNGERKFGGEIVYQLYRFDPDQTAEQQAFDAYALKTSDRVAAGERPDVSLTTSRYEEVLKQGDWYDGTKITLPIDTTRGAGKVIYKRKRGIADKMTAAALERRPGCMIAAIAAALAVIAIVAFLILHVTNAGGPH